jgi:hypothetical protein
VDAPRLIFNQKRAATGKGSRTEESKGSKGGPGVGFWGIADRESNFEMLSSVRLIAAASRKCAAPPEVRKKL